MTCPDLERLLRFSADALGAEETMAIEAHLATCSVCLARVRDIDSLRRQFHTPRETWTVEELKRELLTLNFSTSQPSQALPEISKGRDDLRQEQNRADRSEPSPERAGERGAQLAPRSSARAVSPFPFTFLRGFFTRPAAWGTGVVVLVGALVVLLLISAKPQIITSLNDLPGTVAVTEKEGLLLPGGITLPRWLEKSVAEMMVSGRADPAPKMANLIDQLQSPSALLSGQTEQMDHVVLLSPVATVVRTPFPEFSWQPLPGARAYRLSIAQGGQAGSEVDAKSQTNFVWSPKEPALRPGQTYSWQVETAVDGQLRLSSPATFHVLSAAELVELEQLEQRSQQSAAILTAVYEAYGLFDDATRQCGTLLKLNPTNNAVMRIADRLARRADDRK